MVDVFLSYARGDRDRVRGLVPLLEAQGWSVFWDANIESGRRWDNLIASELENARCVVVIWSQSSVLSDWVKDEATRGREREVLVPVSIDGTRAPLGFRHVQVESIADWSDAVNAEALQRFLAGIRRVVEAAGLQQQRADAKAAPVQPERASLPETFRFDAGADGAFVLDYMTECADNYEATYAMAYLIATQAVKYGRAGGAAPGSMLCPGDKQSISASGLRGLRGRDRRAARARLGCARQRAAGAVRGAGPP